MESFILHIALIKVTCRMNSLALDCKGKDKGNAHVIAHAEILWKEVLSNIFCFDLSPQPLAVLSS